MEKQPLQPEGLENLLGQLYALPDPELLLKAAAIAADFRTWIASHFVLSTQQLNFLAALDNRFVASSAIYCSDFVQRRLPIVLLKTNPEEEEEDKPRGKIITFAKVSTGTDTQPEQHYEASETLTFTISYIVI